MKHKFQVIALCFLLSAIYLVADKQDALLDQESALPDQESAPMPLWLTEHDQAGNESQKLTELLTRVGPNMRSSSDYHDFNDTTLDQALSGWRMLHDLAERFSQAQVRYHRPKLNSLLKEANVSSSCTDSMKLTLDALARLEDWAVLMWGSTGNFPPVGLLDGSYTDLGSYRGCVDMRFNQNDPNSIAYTSHCTVSFRPIINKRPPFHMIFQRVEDPLLHLFKPHDAFSRFTDKAQFFHYIYIKTGICVPHQCSAADVQQVAGVVGRRLQLMSGPVKCFSRAPKPADNQDDVIVDNQPLSIGINVPMNRKQHIAYLAVAFFFGLVLLATSWHALELVYRRILNGKDQEYDYNQESQVKKPLDPEVRYTGIRHLAIHYFSSITNAREFFTTTSWKNEIKCLHGLRAGTMTWIICVHTLQYNDWSAFSRVFLCIPSLQNLALHPVYNANYVVDNFFFMSGLLASYTTWHASKGGLHQFSFVRSLIGRYLRLTPQVLLISLLYMMLPLAGDGPFWYDMSHHASKYCEKNWWVNLLHLQSFYRDDEMCNLVSWWISVDMLYYVVALLLTYAVLRGHTKRAFTSTVGLVVISTLITSYRHYTEGYPPGNLGTVPQISEAWTKFVVHFYWSPFPHAFPFFLGLWTGYALANNMWRAQVRQWSRLGWTLSIVGLISVNMSSHIWMSGALQMGPQYLMTTYNILCVIIWTLAFGWVITACHYGCAPTLNRLLGHEVFVLGSKASFIIYLSHMLVLRCFFGLQNQPMELSEFNIGYSVIGNVVVSTAFGVFLCITFEAPCMKFQKYVVDKLKSQRKLFINFGQDIKMESTTSNSSLK